MFPFPAVIADDKAAAPEQPVDDHGHPHAKDAHSHIFPQDITENDPEDPHGHHGNDHTHPGVAGGPEGCRDGEGHRPEQDTAHRIENDDLLRSLRRDVRQVVSPQDHRKQRHDNGIGRHQADVGDDKKLLRIILHLLVITGAHAAGDHRGHCQGDGHARQHLEGSQHVGDCICRDGIGSKGGDQTENDDLTQLEHTVLQPVWHADI